MERLLNSFFLAFSNFELPPMNKMEASVILQTYGNEDPSLLNLVEVREMPEETAAVRETCTW